MKAHSGIVTSGHSANVGALISKVAVWIRMVKNQSLAGWQGTCSIHRLGSACQLAKQCNYCSGNKLSGFKYVPPLFPRPCRTKCAGRLEICYMNPIVHCARTHRHAGRLHQSTPTAFASPTFSACLIHKMCSRNSLMLCVMMRRCTIDSLGIEKGRGLQPFSSYWMGCQVVLHSMKSRM